MESKILFSTWVLNVEHGLLEIMDRCRILSDTNIRVARLWRIRYANSLVVFSVKISITHE